MLHRRLMQTGAGFQAARVRTLLTAPNGGWTQIQDPKAYYYNGATYFGYLDGNSGDLEVAKYTHSTGSTATTVLFAGYESPPDNHASPAVILRTSDHKVVVAGARHAEISSPKIYISSSAESIAAFGAAIEPDTSIGAAQYTYMVLYQMASGTIYLFYRDYISGTTTGRLAYSTSADGGATWSARTVLYTGATGKVPYWRIQSDDDHIIHIFATDQAPTASKLGHFYLDTDDGKRYASDGTEITASLPIDIDDITLVHAATCWSWGGSVDADGNPATIIMVDQGGSDNAIKVARWRGAWQVDTVVTSVGGHLGINQYASGCAIHHTNPNLVYVARKDTQWEMWRYTSVTDGASWQGVQLTVDSDHDNVWAEVVHHAGHGLEAIWLYGDYTDDIDYDFGVRGYG